MTSSLWGRLTTCGRLPGTLWVGLPGFFLFAAIAQAADPAVIAQQKLDLLDAHKVKPGSTIEFTPIEVNAWARARVPEVVPEGIRDLSVTLGQGTGSASMIVNFLLMRQSKGKETGRIMAWILNGEHPLKVNVRVDSAQGRCTVYLTSVTLSGATLSGTALDYVIQNYFRPLYPDAHINEPFELADDIDRIDFRPTGIRVTIKP